MHTMTVYLWLQPADGTNHTEQSSKGSPEGKSSTGGKSTTDGSSSTNASRASPKKTETNHNNNHVKSDNKWPPTSPSPLRLNCFIFLPWQTMWLLCIRLQTVKADDITVTHWQWYRIISFLRRNALWQDTINRQFLKALSSPKEIENWWLMIMVS